MLKLLKHEFKCYAKLFSFMYLIAILACLITRLVLMIPMEDFLYSILFILSVLFGIFLMVGMIVAIFILCTKRFYDHFMGDEGYLTFTLPVSTTSLLGAKLIAWSAWILLTYAVVFLCYGIILSEFIGFAEIAYVFDMIPYEFDFFFFFFAVLQIITSVIFAIQSIYASIALGQLSNDHRIIMAVIFYIMINTVYQTINTVLTFVLSLLADNTQSYEMLTTSATALSALIFTLINILLFILTNAIISKKLNLK